MDEFDSLAIQEVICSQIGRHADYYLYDRTINNPMNFVINSATEELSADFDIYWVTDGVPAIFCLPGFDPIPVIFNSRYVEIAYLLRRLIGNDALAHFRAELAERISLKLMAEFCLS